MGPKYPFQGIVPDDPSKPPIRQECKDFMSNDIQLSLYIRALTRWYNTVNYNADSGLSYYEISGIHGLPAKHEWNQGGLNPDGYSIYCAHGKITFPTWHRPYMLLFEKQIYDQIQQVIADLTTSFKTDDVKKRWLTEARAFRLPYWDWGLAGANLPSMFTGKSISIVNPVGSNTDWTPNPLTQFVLPKDKSVQLTFQKLVTNFNIDDPDWGPLSETSRYPDANPNPVDGKTSIDKALTVPSWNFKRADKNVVIMPKNPISDYVCRLLSYGTDWQHFSSTQWGRLQTADAWRIASKSWQSYISLEMIHNNLHGWIGGGGQMSDPRVAAFDPVFFNHHCNIDHYFAIYQTLHPGDECWIQPTDSPGESASLVPFINATGATGTSYWTSQLARDWTKLGYQYDILQRKGDESDTARRIRVAGLVKGMYPATGDFLAAPFNEAFLGPEPAPIPDVPKATGSAVAARAANEHMPLAPPEPDEGSAQAPAQELSAQEPVGLKKDETISITPTPLPQLLAQNAAHKGKSSQNRRIYPDYLVNILYDRYALDGHPYTIYVFLGEVTDDDLASAAMNIHHPNYAGMVYTFTANWHETCANCNEQKKAKHLDKAQVPLTLPLLRHAINPDYTAINRVDHETVEDYLVKNLTWRAVDGSGSPISMDRLPRTRVFALKGRAHHYHDEPERLSEYFGYQPMSGATDGKHGGARHHHYDNPGDGLF